MVVYVDGSNPFFPDKVIGLIPISLNPFMTSSTMLVVNEDL